MARPPQEAIDTFVSITGADEAVAVRKLEEHGGDLNQAVNAHFNEGDITVNRTNQSTAPIGHDDMELDGPLDNTFQRSLFPETLRDPFALMDPNFQEHFFDRVVSTGAFNRGVQGSHPREVREVPIEVKDNDPQTGPSGEAPIIKDFTGHESLYGPEVRGTVVIDDGDDDLSSVPSAHHPNVHSNTSQSNPSVPTAPPLVHVADYDNDIEEEMIRAAIEASKRDAEELTNAAEQGRSQHTDGVNLEDPFSDREDMEASGGTAGRQELAAGKAGTSRQLTDEEDFQEETEDVEEQPLVRRRSRSIPPGNVEPTQPVLTGDSPPSSSHPQAQVNRDEFPSEWGGISSEEHDEAVMLEAAMFGGIPEGATYPFSVPSHRSLNHYPQVSPSPALTEQRLLREQQDDEYLASLQADQEKELKLLQELELRRLEEAAAREAALEKQKQEEEKRHKKLIEEEELESNLATKQASLPLEPPPDIEGVVTLVVRMPDGSRQGRRFLKSDKLQFLFDFLDIGRTCKPGTYRLVRSYPRHAFTTGEGDLSFSVLGLTSKQEALFLEQITE